jgi:hypothetical protein
LAFGDHVGNQLRRFSALGRPIPEFG